MVKRFWSADKIVSGSAILISIMTLLVLIYQTNLIREQQRMSVLPYLSMNSQNSFQSDYKIVLNNDGIGPAFIEEVTVVYNGQEYHTDLPVFLQQQTTAFDSIHNILHSNIYKGMLIRAGQRIPVFEVENSLEDAIKLNQLIGTLDKQGMEFKIIYRSVYEEKWEFSNHSSIPKKLN